MVQFMSENVLSMFSPRSFMASCFVFKSLKLFWVYSCFWCEWVFQVHWLTCTVQLSQHHLLKRLFFLPQGHTDYFELNLLKKQLMQEEHSSLSSWKQEMNLSCERYTLYLQIEGHILITRDRESELRRLPKQILFL